MKTLANPGGDPENPVIEEAIVPGCLFQAAVVSTLC